MRGGSHDDIYIVGDAGDRVIELAAGGRADEVRSSVSYRLAAQVEQLTLTGTGRTDAAGNDLANIIVGNANANVIDGKGGADRLKGGAGDDSYLVDHAGDVIVEAAGGGTDAVTSSVSLVLADHVELLTLAGAAGIDGTGNRLANVIVGNANANILDGKAGADRMEGGAGNDVYQVDDSGDLAVEAADAGVDTIVSTIDLTLSANVERLTLSGRAQIGTGNGLANQIAGNAYANILDGADGADLIAGGEGGDSLHGGTGLDALTGGAGADRFHFETALGSDNVDRIADFLADDDTIYLDRTIFAGIAADGRLAASAFHVGAQAADALDRIVYDQATGRIFYDADGLGGAAATLFARIEAGTALTNADFYAVG
jgi:Ca2+-binding RTX toxin-like protein